MWQVDQVDKWKDRFWSLNKAIVADHIVNFALEDLKKIQWWLFVLFIKRTQANGKSAKY